MRNSTTLRPWKTLDRKVIYDNNKFLKVENHVVQLPDGRIIADWAWVIIHDAVIVLARNKDGHFLCFRQTKYAVNGITYAPVGGMIEKNEDPLFAAQRELREETGYTAPVWISLGSYAMDSNRGVNTTYFYLALDAELTSQTSDEDLEDQELLILTKAELQKALGQGKFKVLPLATGISLSLNYLNSLHDQENDQ